MFNAVLIDKSEEDQAEYLKSPGASDLIDRATLSEQGKPMQRERWAGVIDAVGGITLAQAPGVAADVLAGKIKGRLVVDVNA